MIKITTLNQGLRWYKGYAPWPNCCYKVV